MTASTEDDYHPKERGRCDLKLTLNNTNNYRKDVNTCEMLCKTIITYLLCNSSMLVSLPSYSLLLGNSTATPTIVVPALYLAYTAQQKPPPL